MEILRSVIESTCGNDSTTFLRAVALDSDSSRRIPSLQHSTTSLPAFLPTNCVPNPLTPLIVSSIRIFVIVHLSSGNVASAATMMTSCVKCHYRVVILRHVGHCVKTFIHRLTSQSSSRKEKGKEIPDLLVQKGVCCYIYPDSRVV